jgi:hypothetical protein
VYKARGSEPGVILADFGKAIDTTLHDKDSNFKVKRKSTFSFPHHFLF